MGGGGLNDINFSRFASSVKLNQLISLWSWLIFAFQISHVVSPLTDCPCYFYHVVFYPPTVHVEHVVYPLNGPV